MLPQRLQRRRTKGWRKPPNTVCIGRPGPWGNPFKVPKGSDPAPYVAQFVACFEHDMPYRERVRRALAGKDLACWCKPGAPCHADVLLEWANTP